MGRAHAIACSCVLSFTACLGGDLGFEGGSDGEDGEDVDGCASIYRDALLPTFELELSDESWDAISAEFAARGGRTYHPLDAFRYGDELITDAQVRLKGTPELTWVPPKMQFVISFNETNADGRFQGLRKIALDAPPYDPSLLHERLAMSVFRDTGVPTPCTNNARVVLNGEYYGLYANVERVDREFLERNFEDELADANLYQNGLELETNEDTGTLADLTAFQTTQTVAEAEAMGDPAQWDIEWAAEAIMPDSDGYFLYGHNYYLYDHPVRGFLFIPYDKDLAFDGDEQIRFSTPDSALVSPNAPPPANLFVADAAWKPRYIDAVAEVRESYDPDVLLERLDRWEAQIAEAMEDDPSKTFTMDQHVQDIEKLRTFIVARVDWVDAWLACMTENPERSLDQCPG